MLVVSCDRALGNVTAMCAIPLLQCEIVHGRKAPGGRNRDLQLAELGKEATAFQTWISHFPPLHLPILDDL
ncbi:hypothetical protein LguiB_034594 [Lonicera macranthoides]